MKCVILQPGYLPWLGFFDQMHWADVFVIYDDVQYTKRDWRSRNRIKTAHGVQWLSVPVLSKSRRYQRIDEARIVTERNWVHKHLESIQNAYNPAPYFHRFYDDFRDILTKNHKYLLHLDMEFIEYVKDVLGIQARLVYSSSLKSSGSRTTRLIRICRELGADAYMTGDLAAQYLDTRSFEEQGISVYFHQYHHPVYAQLHGAFVPHLSIIDLLFNCGPESLAVLSSQSETSSCKRFSSLAAPDLSAATL